MAKVGISNRLLAYVWFVRWLFWQTVWGNHMSLFYLIRHPTKLGLMLRISYGDRNIVNFTGKWPK